MALSKFFDNSGEPQNAIDYLFNKKHKPELMRGDVSNFLDLANSLDFKNKYTSGVIRAVENLSTEQMDFIMDEYTKFLTEGLNQPPEVLWVKHFEHGETELHFLIPNIDLESGRSFQPYAHKRDLARRDALDNIINAKFYLKDPDDPANMRFTASDKDYLKTSKDRKGLAQAIDKAITNSMLETIKNGGVYDRKAVVDDLKSLGLEVTRVTAKSISVKNEVMKKPMRLKGSFYESTARFDEKSFGAIEKNSSRYRGERKNRLRDNEEEYKRLASRRVEQVGRRYKRSWESVQKKPFADANNSFVGSFGTRPDIVLLNKSDSRKNDRIRKHSTTNRRIQPSKQAKNQAVHERNFSRDSRWHEDKLPFSESLQNRVIECFYKHKKIGEIIDEGNKLVAKNFKSKKATAFNIVKIAQEKGWTIVKTNSKDLDFLKNFYEQAKFKGIEIIPSDNFQKKIFEELKNNDRIRENANRSVKNANRASRELERNGRELDSKSRELERNRRELDSRIRRTETAENLKMAYDDELEKFKTEINLVEHLQNQGFELDRKKSTNKTAVLKSGDDTFLVSRNENGHYVFFDVNSNRGGTIIDFVQSQKSLNLGQVRKELRAYAPSHSFSPSPKSSLAHLEKSSKNEQEQAIVNERFEALKPLNTSYLNSRGIKKIDRRFENVKTDERGNTCFPHYSGGKVCGWEVKNNGFTGFAKGGTRNLFATTNFRDADTVVIVESGIDAMSHAQLFHTDDSVAYISLGGQLTEKQLDVLSANLTDKDVLIATDNDSAGLEFASRIKDAIRHAKWDKPQLKDWNDDLIEYRKEIERATTRSSGSEFEM